MKCDVCKQSLDPDKGEVFLTDDGGVYCADHYPEGYQARFIQAVKDLAKASSELSALWEDIPEDLRGSWDSRYYPSSLPSFDEVDAALFGWACDIERS